MINDKGISHEVFHINCHFYVYIIFCRSAGAERPDSCGDDSDVHQQGGERTEESGESDAATIHRPYLDQGGSGSHYRPAAGVQQLSGLLPFHRQLCRTDIWFLSRDRSVGGQYGWIGGAVGCPSCQRTCRSPVSQAQQDIPRADYEQHRDS